MEIPTNFLSFSGLQAFVQSSDIQVLWILAVQITGDIFPSEIKFEFSTILANCGKGDAQSAGNLKMFQHLGHLFFEKSDAKMPTKMCVRFAESIFR